MITAADQVFIFPVFYVAVPLRTRARAPPRSEIRRVVVSWSAFEKKNARKIMSRQHLVDIYFEVMCYR